MKTTATDRARFAEEASNAAATIQSGSVQRLGRVDACKLREFTATTGKVNGKTYVTLTGKRGAEYGLMHACWQTKAGEAVFFVINLSRRGGNVLPFEGIFFTIRNGQIVPIN